MQQRSGKRPATPSPSPLAPLRIPALAEPSVRSAQAARTCATKPATSPPSPFERRHSPEALVSGTWTGPDHYVLTVRWVETPHVLTIDVDVDGDRVAVAAHASVSFGPTDLGPFAGRIASGAVRA